MPELSEETAAVIARYSDGAAEDLAKQRRLSMQYAFGAGLIALAAIVLQTAWLSLGVWAVFVLWLVLRLRASRVQATAVARALDALRKGQSTGA
ncbi:MAG: hypothetical protein AAFY75_11725 [Pseudomonadota bacterium]